MYLDPAMVPTRGIKPAPSSSEGPLRIALDVLVLLYLLFAYSLGSVLFSLTVKFVGGTNDCARVYSVVGLNTDSYSILVSDLVALVLMMASEMDFLFV